jgi:tether containing UBX domain for GLUT4
LWQVLRQFESGKASNGKNLNITARGIAETADGTGSGGGQLYYEIPVLNVQGRELACLTDFQKTLSQLGYNSGSVLIRLSYKKTDKTLFDAMAEISQYFKEEEEAVKDEAKETEKPSSPPEAPAQEPKEAVQDTTDTPMAETQSVEEKQPEEKATGGEDPEPTKEEDLMEFDNSKPADPLEPVNVFLAPTGSTPAAALVDFNDADYTPSVVHAQIHQARLQHSTRNKRLPSDQEIEAKAAEEAAKIASIKSVLVKVRFPDNTSSDWQVGPSDTGRFLYDAVRHVMTHDDQPFHLVLPGSKTVIKDNDSDSNGLITTYKFSARILLNLVWDDSVPPAVRKKPFLKTSVAQQGQQVKIPEPIVASNDKAGGSALPKLQQSEQGEGSGDKIAKKIPKWLKLGKK